MKFKGTMSQILKAIRDLEVKYGKNAKVADILKWGI